MRAVSFRSALSLRMLGMYVPRAVTDSSAVSLAHVCCCAMLSRWPNFYGRVQARRYIFRESASVPGRVYAAVAVRALPRVSAQLSTSARGRGSLARRGLGSAPARHFRWEGSLRVEAAGPWSSRGSHGAVLLHKVARRLLIRLADSQLKFLGAEIATIEL